MQEAFTNQMKLSIIVAMDEKRGIGKDNRLLFKIPDDMARFRELTRGHPVIMGRKTFESIIGYSGKPLLNRTNIVVTRDPKFDHHKFCNCENCDVFVANSLEDSLRVAQGKPGSDEVFIIGGGQIYKEAIDKGLVDKLYLTIVEGEYDADTFFPDYSAFKKVVFEEEHESGGYTFRFVDLER